MHRCIVWRTTPFISSPPARCTNSTSLTRRRSAICSNDTCHLAKECGWQLEACAVFANHYHIVARGNPDSRNLGEFLHDLHGVSSRELNKRDGVQGRQVWFNFRDTRLTIQHSYLARLNYVHQNAVKHKLVAVANQYPWCSAAWFERVASPAQVKTIYGFKTDRVKVEDDF